MPSIIGSFVTMTTGRRTESLRANQKELVQKWGSDVEPVYEPAEKSQGENPAEPLSALGPKEPPVMPTAESET